MITTVKEYAEDDHHNKNSRYDQIINVNGNTSKDQIINVNGNQSKDYDQIESTERHDNTDLCTYVFTPTYKGSASTVYYYVSGGWGKVPSLMIMIEIETRTGIYYEGVKGLHRGVCSSSSSSSSSISSSSSVAVSV